MATGTQQMELTRTLTMGRAGNQTASAPGLEGWLYLEVSGLEWRGVKAGKEWYHRYFVLDEGHLRYFVDEHDLEPIAAINVRGVEAMSVGKARVKPAFRLNVTRQEDGRYKYVLAGETAEESMMWLKALVEQGVSGNLKKIKLTAKRDPTKAKTVAKKQRSGFLTRKPSKHKKGAGAADVASQSPELTAESQGLIGKLASQTLLSRQSTLGKMADAGEVAGDRPFTEVLEEMGRDSLAARVSRVASQSRMSQRMSAAEQGNGGVAFPGVAQTPVEEEEEDSGDEQAEPEELEPGAEGEDEAGPEGDDEEEGGGAAGPVEYGDNYGAGGGDADGAAPVDASEVGVTTDDAVIVGAEPPPRRSLLKRLGSSLGSGLIGSRKDSSAARTSSRKSLSKSKKEKDEEPGEPPEMATVRTWMGAVLLAADDVTSHGALSAKDVSLRETLRSGVLLCAMLNALQPNAVGKLKAPAKGANRFAKLEALETYKRACIAAGMDERDALDPTTWMDGETMSPLHEHLVALCKLFPSAPKFLPPDRQAGGRKAKIVGKGGAVPHASAMDLMGDKARGGKTTRRSVAAKGASAWRGANSNASAARAVFDLEKGAGTVDPAKAGGGTGAALTLESDSGATHSFAESETIAFSEFINEALGADPSLSHLLPLAVNTMDLFDALRDGVILCKLINCAVPETIDVRCVHTGASKPLSVYEVVENLNMAINAAVAIGCRVVNIGPDDVMAGAPHLCLGLLWQIVKAAIMANINLKASPALVALLGDQSDGDISEALKALKSLAPEKLLLKWLNYQVQRVAPESKEVTNFGAALKDCAVYAHLLSAVAPADGRAAVSGLVAAVAAETDPTARAKLVIEAADALGVSQFKVRPHDIAKGNEKLNMGFVAAIFNALPGLEVAAQTGVFNPALASSGAQIIEGGHGVRLEENGSALFGVPLEPPGLHFIELQVLQATDPHCFVGLMHSTADKQYSPGLVEKSASLSGGGKVHRDAAPVTHLFGMEFGAGDLVRVEYDADARELRWAKNGGDVEVTLKAIPPGMHFAVGRTAGIFEVKLVNSSSMGREGSASMGGGNTAEELLAALAALEEDESDSREERAFRMWINSLGLDGHVTNLSTEVQDGLLLLRLMDAIKPGVVDWSKVSLKPKNVHAKVINCNYAVSLGKGSFGFSLVGIQGKDLQDGITKLVLALTWQLMRFHVINFLSSMSEKQLTEKDVLDWANAKVASTSEASGYTHQLSKLQDSSISTGHFVLHLIKAVAPRAVDLSIMTPGETPEDKRLNARLAVSCARKAGCMVFLLWEDITEYKPKMLLVLFATLMQLDLANAPPKA